MKLGWVSIHRQLQEHWLWKDKPFSKGQAWIDMLMLANHADKKFLLGNELVEVKTGSFITSELKLAERWGWSKTKVRAFLSLLQSDSMIIKKTDRKKTTIIIENYSDYQDVETTKKPQKNHEETTKEPRKNTNNNVNNDNNDNKYIYCLVIDYLNEKAGTNYKASAKKTQTHIHARLAEGFAVDDFKTVIDNKCADWLNNEKMSRYLRPETLFGTKFESYLNESAPKKQNANTFIENMNDLDDLF